ncbi:glutamate--cysteine ligase [Legionella israelensis]|uniref:YbdK family carboxylate-amine ligase n=1 Tax=Legionella israelensis TaxID=454 RepID=UPI00117D67CD|nr:YbdK family carboxylate-amine ligase [Legionella israelensis]QDP73009.1 glutamate--cysteine ligase [Legionella israelensis]
MKLLPFKASHIASIGVELEFQIIDTNSYILASRAKDLIRALKETHYQKLIKPEITQSMIEINSSIHDSPMTLLKELFELQAILLAIAAGAKVNFCGGGTHPFQKWTMQKIFPTQRYKKISHTFRYLAKRATVFGQHIHIGCANGDDAIYLTHAFARYVPQFIALSASSPFYQGIDTGFFSSRSNVFNAFPLGGRIPALKDWQEFSSYFYKMRDWGVIDSMKDVYWDVRPKPELGTVEIRVFDTPLMLRKTALIVAYVQALALYLLEEKSIPWSSDLYYLYNYNRFQASRYGFEGEFVNPFISQRILIADDILATIKKIEKYARQIGSSEYIAELKNLVMNNKSDAIRLRDQFNHLGSFPKVVAEQCQWWREH